MSITGITNYARQYADLYQNFKQTDVPRAQVNIDEVATNKTSAQIQGTGSFTRIYGGKRGTLQHIDISA